MAPQNRLPESWVKGEASPSTTRTSEPVCQHRDIEWSGGKMNPDGNRRHGYGRIGQHSGKNLVAAAACAVGAFHHGGAYQPADADRHVTDDPALQENGNEGVADQPYDGCADAVGQGAYKRGITDFLASRRTLPCQTAASDC